MANHDPYKVLLEEVDPEKEDAPAVTEAREEKQLASATIQPAEKIGNLPTTAPAALRDLPGWLIWRYENGDKKPRKVPYYAAGNRRKGIQGSADDRRQLTSFETARAAAERRNFDGVGLALLPEFNVVALDFDQCMVDDDVRPDVERLVGCTYAEYSPSGQGVRAFMRGDLGNRKDNCAPFGFETFSSKGFVTFTGNRLFLTDLLGTDDTVADVTEEVRAFATARFGRKVKEAGSEDPLMTYEPRLGLSYAPITAALETLDADMPHDPWLHVGMAIHYETEGSGFELWDSWSTKGNKYPGYDHLQRRWESFGGMTGRPVTARYLVKLANENGARIALDLASADDFEDITDEATAAEDLRFPVVPAGEFSRAQPPGWIIKGVLPRAELVVLFGESGSGKSFLALDIGAAIARGIEWRGNKTKQGRVVYIAAEGGGGFRNRLRAYGVHHKVDLDELPFGIIHATPNFLQKADVVDVGKAIAAGGKADVVIVDTLAQVIPGANENAGEDIGKAISNCRAIHKATGAVVILVHHAGKDPTRGARGWSGLKGAVDAEIEVQRMPAGRMVRISKQKDGADDREWGFDLDAVPIGMDEDGDVVTSCVIKEAEVPMTGRIGSAGRRPLGKWEHLVQKVIDEFSNDRNNVIKADQVVDEAVRQMSAPDAGKRDTRRQLAKRALQALCEGDEAPYSLEHGCLSVLR